MAKTNKQTNKNLQGLSLTEKNKTKLRNQGVVEIPIVCGRGVCVCLTALNRLSFSDSQQTCNYLWEDMGCKRLTLNCNIFCMVDF